MNTLAEMVFDTFAEDDQLSAVNWHRLVCAALSCRDRKDLTLEYARADAEKINPGSFPINKVEFVLKIDGVLELLHITQEQRLVTLQRLVTTFAKRGASTWNKEVQAQTSILHAEGHTPAMQPAAVTPAAVTPAAVTPAAVTPAVVTPSEVSAGAPGGLQGDLQATGVDQFTDQLNNFICTAKATNGSRSVGDRLSSFEKELKRLLGEMKKHDCQTTTAVQLRELDGDAQSKCKLSWTIMVEDYLSRIQSDEIDQMVAGDERSRLNSLAEKISRLLKQQVAELRGSYAMPSSNPRGPSSGGDHVHHSRSRSPERDRSRSPCRQRLRTLTTGSTTEGSPETNSALGAAFRTRTLPNDKQ